MKKFMGTVLTLLFLLFFNNTDAQQRRVVCTGYGRGGGYRAMPVRQTQMHGSYGNANYYNSRGNHLDVGSQYRYRQVNRGQGNPRYLSTPRNGQTPTIDPSIIPDLIELFE